MRQYTVRLGDSPASIAAEHAGCPKCARDLIKANTHKPAVVHPNGFVTFTGLRAGETLNLPDKWFSKEFDELPKTYFQALPYPDGITPSTLGDRAAGILADFAAIEDAARRVGAMATMNDDEFRDNISPAASAIDRSVSDTPPSREAGDARAAAARARAKEGALRAAMSADDASAAFNARDAILHDLSDGLVAARAALAGTDESIPVSTGPTNSPAPAVSALRNLNPCAPPSAAVVCAAQIALQLAPDGKYGPETAGAARRVLPDAPGPCVPRPPWWAASGQSNCSGVPRPPLQPPSSTPATNASREISTAGIIGIGLIGAGTVGGAIYLTTRQPRRARRRNRRR